MKTSAGSLNRTLNLRTWSKVRLRSPVIPLAPQDSDLLVERILKTHPWSWTKDGMYFNITLENGEGSDENLSPCEVAMKGFFWGIGLFVLLTIQALLPPGNIHAGGDDAGPWVPESSMVVAMHFVVFFYVIWGIGWVLWLVASSIKQSAPWITYYKVCLWIIGLVALLGIYAFLPSDVGYTAETQVAWVKAAHRLAEMHQVIRLYAAWGVLWALWLLAREYKHWLFRIPRLSTK